MYELNLVIGIQNASEYGNNKAVEGFTIKSHEEISFIFSVQFIAPTIIPPRLKTCCTQIANQQNSEPEIPPRHHHWWRNKWSIIIYNPPNPKSIIDVGGRPPTRQHSDNECSFATHNTQHDTKAAKQKVPAPLRTPFKDREACYNDRIMTRGSHFSSTAPLSGHRTHPGSVKCGAKARARGGADSSSSDSFHC